VVNNDDCGVTSFGDATINKIHRVVCPNHFVAVLLHTQFAFFAAQTGANHASHSHLLPHFELGLWHLGTGLHHYPHYLMPRNQGVLGISPFVAHLVQIRMANATKQDLDLHIFRTSCPSEEFAGGKSARRIIGSPSMHWTSSCLSHDLVYYTDDL